MEKRALIEGDIVQISPDIEKFPGQLVVVTESKIWGCQGVLYMNLIQHACRYNGLAYVRLKWEEMEYCGRVEWIYKYVDDF